MTELEKLALRTSPLANVLAGGFPDGLHVYDPSLMKQPTGTLTAWMFYIDHTTICSNVTNDILNRTRALDIMMEPVAHTRKSSLCIFEATKNQVSC
jgi:hypothetical protein